jgi:hypothetical protein
MSTSKIDPCPHCGSPCLAFAIHDGTPEGKMAIQCLDDGCRASGPRRRWIATTEEELIRAHNAFARRAVAGREMVEAVVEAVVEAGGQDNSGRFVPLRGRAS